MLPDKTTCRIYFYLAMGCAVYSVITPLFGMLDIVFISLGTLISLWFLGKISLTVSELKHRKTTTSLLLAREIAEDTHLTEYLVFFRILMFVLVVTVCLTLFFDPEQLILARILSLLLWGELIRAYLYFTDVYFINIEEELVA